MSSWRIRLKRHSLIAGLLLMFFLTWPIDLAHAGVFSLDIPFAIYIFLGWGFIIAALVMTGLTAGRREIEALLKRYLIWRVSWHWYLVAFLLYPAIFLTATSLHAVWTGAPVDISTTLARRFFGSTATLPLFILPFFLFEAIANGEELGWRGYVLPRLQARYNALVSSLILGLVWGFWHLPKYLGPESGPFGLSMVKFLGDAILFTWLYNNTRGSLLLVTILHASGNTAAFFLPLANTMNDSNMGAMVIAVALIDLTAVAVTILTGSERLSRANAKQVSEIRPVGAGKNV